MAKDETPGQRLDRKIAERGQKSDKAREAAHKAALKEQETVDDAVTSVTRDADGDPVPIGA